ncbi:MAG: hypothetical protein JW776_03325 [Candidatus Lokiarchaeota archaeon]|nr:hypothetical protein [Candidatus Lokiarchaeota archaeon]
MAISVWNEILEKFQIGLTASIEHLKERDIENIPGAKERLIEKFTQIRDYLPRNNGELLLSMINDSIQARLFPNIEDIVPAFNQILNARTPEQDYIISELIDGFISSQGKTLFGGTDRRIIDNLVEAFKKRRDFKIVDHQFYAMFGDPNKPRKYVQERLEKIAKFLGLQMEILHVEQDVRDGKPKDYKFYSFPEEITTILEGKYLQIQDNGEKVITDEFDKMVFISYFLATQSVNRKNLDKYAVNGICAIFALILLLSFMPKLEVDETNPINRDDHFNSQTMSIIPKSWLTKDILSELMTPLVQLIAYRVGGINWLDKIILTEKNVSIHLQAQFLLKDVNKWVLGNMCRVEIPIFVEISNIFSEIIIGTERGEE